MVRNHSGASGNSFWLGHADSQLAADEALARELQELEDEFAAASLEYSSDDEPGSRNEMSRGSSSSSAWEQAVQEDHVDPDNMTYEELQALGDEVGTEDRGLSDEQIERLPLSTYWTGFFSKKKEQCVICCLDYKSGDILMKLFCRHRYHSDCATKWLKIKKTCPVCNAQVFGS